MLEHINDDAYVIDLPGKYNVSCTFNVADLSPFDFEGGLELRKNPFQEGKDDTTPPEDLGRGPWPGGYERDSTLSSNGRC